MKSDNIPNEVFDGLYLLERRSSLSGDGEDKVWSDGERRRQLRSQQR